MSKPIITTQQRLANFSAKFDAAIQDKTIFPSLNSPLYLTSPFS